MIPYADLLYFGLLICPAAAAVALGLTGHLSWRRVMVISLLVLAVQLATPVNMTWSAGLRNLVIVSAYGSFQYGIARTFLRIRRSGRNAAAFRLALAASLAPLAIVKIVPLSGVTEYVGFLGISYVTFRALDVVICIHDRLIHALPPGMYGLYLLFFPTISAGPVDRYNRFVADLARPRSRQEYLKDMDEAVHRLFRGLLYKFVLAALVEQYWMTPVSTMTGVLNVVSYMYAYALYLFFDFAGYSAFAIGVSYLFGVHTPENFNRPFLATDIVEFWNRWHISLSMWFRDHIYMRFMMAAMRGKWLSSKLAMSCAAFYVSFGLMGLWHGISPRYIVYGLYHATLLSGHVLLTDYRRTHPQSPARPTWNVTGIFVTFHLVCFGLLIFSGRLGG